LSWRPPALENGRSAADDDRGIRLGCVEDVELIGPRPASALSAGCAVRVSTKRRPSRRSARPGSETARALDRAGPAVPRPVTWKWRGLGGRRTFRPPPRGRPGHRFANFAGRPGPRSMAVRAGRGGRRRGLAARTKTCIVFDLGRDLVGVEPDVVSWANIEVGSNGPPAVGRPTVRSLQARGRFPRRPSEPSAPNPGLWRRRSARTRC